MTPATTGSPKKIPKAIWLLGATSLLNDASSELIAAVLPLYLASIGASGLGVGLIAGLEEATRSLLSLATGYGTDRAQKRMPFVLSGYAISAVAKTLIAFTFSWLHVLGLRMLDRAGKAVRTPARDALIASVSNKKTRGFVFGIHRAFDTAGALLGSLIALFAVWVLDVADFSVLILIGGVIGFSSLLPLLAIRERVAESARKAAATLRGSLRTLPRKFFLALAGLSLFAAANLSYMFFLLAVNQSFTEKLALGVPIAMYVVFNLSYVLLAVPFGKLSDRWGRRPVLALGYLLFAGTALGFAFIGGDLPLFVMLFVVYGAAIALLEGNQRAWVSDLVPDGQRGLALGVFNLAIGVSALIGNGLAGLLWTAVAPQAAFALAAALAAAAALTLFVSAKAKS